MESSNEVCGTCSTEEDENMVGCDKCFTWFHFQCVLLDEELVNQIKYFYCDACCLRHGVTIEWKTPQATAAQKNLKRREYYDVEAIVAHRIRRLGVVQDRYFRIKWKGYGVEHNTWEPESNLDGCIHTLQTYLKRNNLKYSRMTGFVGAKSANKNVSNEKNWIKIENILEKFQSLVKSHFPKSLLQATIFDYVLDNNDQLYFFKYLCHCYVILWLAQKKVALIADGVNSLRNDYEVAKDLRSLLKCKVKYCDFVQQAKADHCGTSAILIGLEFVRAYETKILPNQLVAPRSWKAHLEKELHKEKSVSVRTLESNFVGSLTCVSCGKRFRSNKLKSFRHHQQKCPKKANNNGILGRENYSI